MNIALLPYILLLWGVAIAIFCYGSLNWFRLRAVELEMGDSGRGGGKFSFGKFFERSATQRQNPNVVFLFTAIVAGFLGFLVMHNLLTGIVLALIGFMVPRILYGRRLSKRKKLLQEQFAPALWLVVNSMKAGQNLAQAFNTAAADLPDPMSAEFGNLSRQIKLGVPMEAALATFDQRINTSESRTSVKAMIISLRTGANLPEAMGRIAASISTRVKLERKIKALTAQGKAQGWIMGAIPFVLALAFSVVNPKYGQTLFQTTGGNIILAVVIVMETCAFFMIRQITRVPL